MINYKSIDMQKTGKRIEAAIRSAGLDVKTVQDYLHLSCPQPIYRWFKGQILPTVDHLYVLCGILDVHMEELLVPKQRNVHITLGQEKGQAFVSDERRSKSERHLLAYYEGICDAA